MDLAEVYVFYLRIADRTQYKPKDISRKGRALLAYAVRKKYGFDSLPAIEKGEHEKPYFAGYPDIHFNISHSGDYVITALAEIPVGIDIEEKQDREFLSLGRLVFSPSEKEHFMTCGNRMDEFFRLWVRKEAYIKWTGEGLSRDLRELPLDGYYEHLAIDPSYDCAVQAGEPFHVTLEEVFL